MAETGVSNDVYVDATDMPLGTEDGVRTGAENIRGESTREGLKLISVGKNSSSDDNCGSSEGNVTMEISSNNVEIPREADDCAVDADSDSSESEDDDGGNAEGNRENTGLMENGSEQNGKQVDSSGEFCVPDDETVLAVFSQIEELFSDANLVKESYLLKHIRRNKHGFVSLKVVNSLRKMKRLTRDYRLIAYAVKKHSTLLELNENETKVRRKDALTNPVPPATSDKNDDDEIPAENRTVIVANLSTEKVPTVSSVAELFARCGPIAQIRIIAAGSSGTLSGNVGKLLAKHLQVNEGCYALIEFEQFSDAKKACKKMTNVTDWRHGMRVTMLVPETKKSAANSSGNNSQGEKTPGARGESPEYGSGSDSGKKKPRKKKLNTRVDQLSRAEFCSSSGSIYSSSGSDTEGRHRSDGAWRAYRNDSPGGSDSGMRRRQSSPKGGARNSPLLISHVGSKAAPAHDSDSEDWRTRSGSFGSYLEGNPRGQSPWALRRLQAQQANIGASGGSAGSLVTNLEGISAPRGPVTPDSDRVLRQPKGPDGSQGFRLSRVSQLKLEDSPGKK